MTALKPWIAVAAVTTFAGHWANRLRIKLALMLPMDDWVSEGKARALPWTRKGAVAPLTPFV